MTVYGSIMACDRPGCSVRAILPPDWVAGTLPQGWVGDLRGPQIRHYCSEACHEDAQERQGSDDTELRRLYLGARARRPAVRWEWDEALGREVEVTVIAWEVRELPDAARRELARLALAGAPVLLAWQPIQGAFEVDEAKRGEAKRGSALDALIAEASEEAARYLQGVPHGSA